MHKSRSRPTRASCESKALRCVEQLLERDISDDQVLEAGEILSANQYKDVIEERNIEQMCGYPLCDTLLGPITKQKYHVSVTKKQVIDLTERKKFCSDKCYNCSQYFAAQLSTLPLWSRTNPIKVKFKLLSHGDSLSGKQGSVAQDVKQMDSRLKLDPIEHKSCSKTPEPPQIAPIKEKSIPILHVLEPVSDISRSSRSDDLAGNDENTIPQPPTISQVSKLLNAISTWISLPQSELHKSHDKLTSCSERQTSHDEGNLSYDVENTSGNLSRDEENTSHDRNLSHDEENTAHDDENTSYDGRNLSHDEGNTSHDESSRSHKEESEMIFLPPVDSVDVSRIQRSLFTNQLRRHLSGVCSTLDLPFHVILPQISKTVSKFRLTRHSITFRVTEWKIICLLLIIMSCMEVSLEDLLSKAPVRHMLEEIKATPQDFQLMLASFN